MKGKSKFNVLIYNSLKEIASDVLKYHFKNVYNSFQTENIKLLYFLFNGKYLLNFDENESLNLILIYNEIKKNKENELEIIFQIPHQVFSPIFFHDQNSNLYHMQTCTFQNGEVMEGVGSKQKNGKKIWEGTWKNVK